MRLKRLWIDGFKNLNNFEIDFSDKEGITVLIGNNGSGKSNVLEAISAIFTGLFKMSTPQRKPKFEYEIEYVLNDDEYKLSLKNENNNFKYLFEKNENNILIKDMKLNPQKYLPSQIIAIYSGEETRLWNEYYTYLHNDFISLVKSNELRTLPPYKLFYIDSDYWSESLLILLFSDLENNKNFIRDYLKISEVNKIKFYFDIKKINKFPKNIVVNFVNKINPDTKKEVSFTLSDLKTLMNEEYEKDLFIKLISATLSGLISDIEITFNNTLSVASLSEGEKKQILLRIALEVVADENSLILFDEPDANIHVSNKGQIKTMLDEYENRENILTTHSPTLMNKFENHLVYLENGEVKGHEKAEILKEISGDLMSFSEQQIVLNSNSDILLVEGKLDIIFIKEAIQKLDGYNELENIIFIPTGGASGLRLFIDKFTANDNQKIIAILDNDKAGKSEVKEILTDVYQTQLNDNGYVKIEELKNTFLLILPKPDTVTNNQYEIEDFFPLNKLIDISKTQIDTFKVLKDFIIKKEMVKKKLSEKCSTYDSSDFEHFKKLFDLIVEIKELP